MSEDGFGSDDNPTPYAFLQWKNTDACFDFYCECGAHCHFDGFFAYAVKCPHCDTVWEMPWRLFPRKATAHKTDPYWLDNAQPMQPDEKHCDEVKGDDGAFVAVPRKLKKKDDGQS